MTTTLRCAAFAALIATLGAASAQTTPPLPTQKPTSAPATTTPTPTPPRRNGPRPYEEIVTKEAVSQDGMFRVHRIDDRILWEVPAKMLGRELLWQTEVAQVDVDSGDYPGTAAGTQVIRFDRRGDKLLMKIVGHGMRAMSDDELKVGVAANTVEPIIGAYTVLAEGKDKSAVVDVTSLFISDPTDFSVRSLVGGMGVDPSRSFIEKVKAYPENIETTSTLTFSKGGRSFSFGGQMFSVPANSATTAVVHYSLVALPEVPMAPRLKDSRIGYFTTDFVAYGRPDYRAETVRYIDRFRLEKKDPTAKLSEPKKPIVFYLAREVPTEWRPAMKRAVEAWNVAFEQAGFKNAIQCKNAPSLKDDPDWSDEDARFNVIRWAPSETANAMGPHISDPRSGETISAHVIVWHNILDLVQDWYFSQMGATDPRAARLPLPHPLMEDLVQYVVCHEVGHTLGLEHNFKASAAYSIAQLRDPEFTKTHGVAASIMSYSRYNYVAQPGDKVTSVIGMIGPYDKFAIQYGYEDIPNAKTPDDEKPILDALLSKQVSEPDLRFGNYEYMGIDPSTQMEDIGDDAVEATRLGLLNIDRIATTTLFTATTRFGEDYTRLAEMRSELLGQRARELNHVAMLVGGVVETDYHYGRGGDVFTPVPKARQKAAVALLLDKGMHVDPALYGPQILNKIQPVGVVAQATGISNLFLNTLLGESRIRRMQDNEAMNGANAYTVTNLVSDLSAGIWSETAMPTPKIDVYRRNLQRQYLSTMDGKVNGSSATINDLRPIVKADLRNLAHRIDLASARTTDVPTKNHLIESRRDIENILNNKYKPAGGGASTFSLADLFGIKDKGADGCWDGLAGLRSLSEPTAKPVKGD